MKTTPCPACLAKLVGDAPVCPRCGQILASYHDACYMPIGKKRIFPGSVYITENRLVVRPGDAYMDNFGMAGGIAAIVAEKNKKAYPELDSPWGEISEIRYPNGKFDTVLNAIKADSGILITYTDGVQIVVGLSVENAVQAAELMKAQLSQFSGQSS